jgi:hypothetical protein
MFLAWQEHGMRFGVWGGGIAVLVPDDCTALTLWQTSPAILMLNRQDVSMALRPFFLLLFGTAVLPVVHARAQGSVCATATGQCSASALKPEGTQCHCPADPGVMGMVGVTAVPPVYPGYPPHRREELSNDDIDDDGDVLAGPRRHHRGRYRDEDDDR